MQRRQFLTAAALAGIAGCSAGGASTTDTQTSTAASAAASGPTTQADTKTPAETATPAPSQPGIGDAVENKGLRMAALAIDRTASITYTHGQTDDAPEGYAYLLVKLRVENVGDVVRAAPSILDDSIEAYHKDRKAPSLDRYTDMTANGQSYPSYEHTLGEKSEQGDLTPGTTVVGWAPFKLAAGFDGADVRLIAELPYNSGETVTWTLKK